MKWKWKIERSILKDENVREDTREIFPKFCLSHDGLVFPSQIENRIRLISLEIEYRSS